MFLDFFFVFRDALRLVGVRAGFVCGLAFDLAFLSLVSLLLTPPSERSFVVESS
jgi:hypothetical protein